MECAETFVSENKRDIKAGVPVGVEDGDRQPCGKTEQTEGIVKGDKGTMAV